MAETVEADAQQADCSDKKKRRFPVWAWIVIWVVSGLSLAALTVIALIVISFFLKEGADQVAFVTGNILNAWIVIAIIAQVVIYSKQWRVMEGQLTTAERAIRIENRAYLAVGGANLDHELTVGSVASATVRVVNGGKTPAKEVRVRVNLGFSPDPATKLREPLPVSAIESVAILAKDGGMNTAAQAHPAVTKEVLALFRDRRINLFVWGCAEYKDFFGDAHKTHFFFQAPSVGVVLRICPVGNDAD